MYAAGSLVATALLLAPAPWSWVGAAGVVVIAAAVPRLFELHLSRWQGRVQSAGRGDVDHLLTGLRTSRWIRSFAPHGWRQVQEGALHMRRGDGRAAAGCFAEAGRLCRIDAERPPLTSAQAHALVLAGDRVSALELLEGLVASGRATARDHLDLALTLLPAPGRNRDVRAHLEHARPELGEHPRWLAASALAQVRDGREPAAWTAFQAAESALERQGDPMAPDLLKRARKGLRGKLEREQRRARDVTGADPAPESTPVPAKERRRSRRERRREKRRAAAAAVPVVAAPVVAAPVVAPPVVAAPVVAPPVVAPPTVAPTLPPPPTVVPRFSPPPRPPR